MVIADAVPRKLPGAWATWERGRGIVQRSARRRTEPLQDLPALLPGWDVPRSSFRAMMRKVRESRLARSRERAAGEG